MRSKVFLTSSSVSAYLCSSRPCEGSTTSSHFPMESDTTSTMWAMTSSSNLAASLAIFLTASFWAFFPYFSFAWTATCTTLTMPATIANQHASLPPHHQTPPNIPKAPQISTPLIVEVHDTTDRQVSSPKPQAPICAMEGKQVVGGSGKRKSEDRSDGGVRCAGLHCRMTVLTLAIIYGANHKLGIIDPPTSTGKGSTQFFPVVCNPSNPWVYDSAYQSMRGGLCIESDDAKGAGRG